MEFTVVDSPKIGMSDRREVGLQVGKFCLNYMPAASYGGVLRVGGISAMSSIEERVKKIVVEQLGVKEEEVTTESSFVDDLGADSLDTVELVMALEEEFKTEIPDEEAEKITTVQQAIDYISNHAQA